MAIACGPTINVSISMLPKVCIRIKSIKIIFYIQYFQSGSHGWNIIWYTLDSIVQCHSKDKGYKGETCSDCQQSMDEHGEWQNNDCVCADDECSKYHLHK